MNKILKNIKFQIQKKGEKKHEKGGKSGVFKIKSE